MQSMKIPLLTSNVIFGCLGIISVLIGIGACIRPWMQEPLLGQFWTSLDFATAILMSMVLIPASLLFRHYLINEPCFWVFSETRAFSGQLNPAQALVIEPLVGLEGKFLLVELKIEKFPIEKKLFATTAVRYPQELGVVLQLFGSNPGVSQLLLETNNAQIWASEETAQNLWRVTLPVAHSFSSYSLHVYSEFSVQLRIHLAVGLLAKDIHSFQQVSIRSAPLIVQDGQQIVENQCS